MLGTHAHPNIALYGHSLKDYVVALEEGDYSEVADLMLESAARLARAGADFVVCPDNTIHTAIDLVRQRSPLPWLHIAETVAHEARDRGVRKAAVLGTKWLVASDVYPKALEAEGIDYLRPNLDEQLETNRIIMDELVNDIQNPESVFYFQRVIGKMRDRGCDAVILGCTEIPLIISDQNSELPTLDSTRLLADAALRFSIANSTGSMQTTAQHDR